MSLGLTPASDLASWCRSRASRLLIEAAARDYVLSLDLGRPDDGLRALVEIAQAEGCPVSFPPGLVPLNAGRLAAMNEGVTHA